MGLAWTAMGGSTLFIETAKRKLAKPKGDAAEGALHLTGHLGDVMKESAQIALTVARNFIKTIGTENNFLETKWVWSILFYSGFLHCWRSKFHFAATSICMYPKVQHPKTDQVPA